MKVLQSSGSSRSWSSVRTGNFTPENAESLWTFRKTPMSISFLYGATVPSGQGPPHYRGFAITLRHNTLGRTPLDEWSTRRRDFYLTTHNTHKRQTFHARRGIRTRNPTKRATVDLRLRPRSHWDRHPRLYLSELIIYSALNNFDHSELFYFVVSTSDYRGQGPLLDCYFRYEFWGRTEVNNTPMSVRWLIINLTHAFRNAQETSGMYACIPLYKREQECLTLTKQWNTGHTQKNGAVLIVNTIKTAPFFCVCPVYSQNSQRLASFKIINFNFIITGLFIVRIQMEIFKQICSVMSVYCKSTNRAHLSLMPYCLFIHILI
jgi:hypothetical protein